MTQTLRTLILCLAAAACLPAQDDVLITVLKGADALALYDADSGSPIVNIPVGLKPHEFALTKDGKYALVTEYGLDSYTSKDAGGNTISIVDMKERKVIGSISTGEYRRPHGIERGESGLFYVSTEVPGAVHVVDLKKKKILKTIPVTGKMPHMVQVTKDERKAWTADAGSGSVSVVDLAAGKETANIEVGGVPMGFALDAEEKRLYVSTRTGNQVVVVSPFANQVVKRIGVPGSPSRLLLVNNGERLLVSLMDTGEVASIHTGELVETKRLKVGARPEGMVADPDGQHAYVAAQADNVITRFTVPGLEPVLTIKTGAKPDPMVILRSKPKKK